MAVDNANTIEPEVIEEEVSSLPSEEGTEVNPYDLSAFKGEDGKLAGKFDNAEDLMKSYNEAQEFIKKINAERASEGNAKAKAEIVEARESTLLEVKSKLAQEFAKGEASEESIVKAKELGMTDEGIKLMQLETKLSMDKIIAKVGSIEQYDTMINTLAEHMSVEEKQEFNSMINSNTGSEIALLGLQAKYEQITGTQSNTYSDRVRGSINTTSGIKGYSSQAEMLADLRYVQTTGRNDKAALARYEAKARLTPDNIAYNR